MSRLAASVAQAETAAQERVLLSGESAELAELAELAEPADLGV